MFGATLHSMTHFLIAKKQAVPSVAHFVIATEEIVHCLAHFLIAAKNKLLKLLQC